MEIFGYFIPMKILLMSCAGVCLLAFLFAFIAFIMSVRAKIRYKKILRDGAGRDITEAIVNYYEKCADIMQNYNQAEERLKKLERESKACVKKIGSIRYNAFGGNNGNLSFAAAVLDDSDTGFVINGVYTSQQTATYLKPINKGTSVFELTEEDMEAIKTAKLNYQRNIER
ncbi:MAG: DUF4446 family protein [Clostridia bacterium]|nr:DUF4446 family protein [Clostridia bacterium]